MRTQTLEMPFSSARFTSALAPADHPLFALLTLACRKGDLEGVKRLVANDVPINARDAWDATPLYYASFCGHEEVVRFLLKAGAQADPATFEGERCASWSRACEAEG
jgi:ankyrin repeat protein